MNKIHYYVFPFTLLLVIACTSTQRQYPDNDRIPLENLVNHLPASDSVESKLLFDAILGYGDEGVVDICKLLRSEDDQLQIQSRWALNGLTVYVTDSEREQLRKIYVSGLLKALDLPFHETDKAYIINQLQLSGKDESVSRLSGYINDPILYKPVIKTLISIGSESA